MLAIDGSGALANGAMTAAWAVIQVVFCRVAIGSWVVDQLASRRSASSSLDPAFALNTTMAPA